jgi:alkylation response protein AidB-like acyl-CoA dehydrogenase
MKFAFTSEQLEMRDVLRDLLTKECSPAHVRDAWINDTGRVPGLWDKLVDMGVVGVLAPESSGGLGLTFVDLVLLLEESGRHAVPEPIVETAAVGVPLFGDPSAVVAAADALVPWADTAAIVITAAGRFDPATIALTPRSSVDGSRRLFEVRGAATRVDGIEGAFDRGMLGTAAQQCGLADRMLELTVDHVKTREQFGVPVGSFQAVKHHLANARLALEFAQPLVYRAAVTLDPVHVSMAKLKATAAASVTARVALQCHGAIGYTTEYDLHLYLKRSWALAGTWGDERFHRRRVARAIL